VERNLTLAWIEAAIAAPDAVDQDTMDPTVTRVWKRIPDAAGRVLRVVCRSIGTDILVITAFFDRKAQI
jgi:hypothetical protein